MGETVFGRIVLNMIRTGPPPIARALSTNSFSRRDRVLALVIRANGGMKPTAMASIAFRSDGPRMATMRIASSKAGNARITSTIRISMLSTHLPKYPATRPTVTPIVVANNMARSPTCSETLPPWMRRIRLSRPKESVPMGCSMEGGSMRAS